MDNPFGARRLPQDRESPPHWERGPHLQWRSAYARAAETKASNEIGQDCIVLAPAEDGLAFCLTDGVSQSFFGDLAASALGDALVNWLSGLPSSSELAALESSQQECLQRLRADVSEDVAQYPLPGDLPIMLTEVLEQKRRLGSESMFVCGRLWIPGPACPEGQLLLSWLGDMRCRVWRGQGEALLGGNFRTEDRWSSRRGNVGQPQFHRSALVGLADGPVRRVVVYSDGLASLDSLADPPTDEALQRMIDDSGRSPKSDDVSFLDILVPVANENY